MIQIAIQPIWEGLAEHKWSDAQLAGLDAELSPLDFLADYKFSIRGERAAHGKIIDFLEQKRSRYWQFFGILEGSDWRRSMMNTFLGTTAFYLAPRGWFDQGKIVVAQMSQQWNLPTVDDAQQIVSPEKTAQAENAIETLDGNNPVNFFAKLLLPALGNYAKKIARGQTAVNLARVAIALERHHLAHGEYPDTLDTLVPQFMAKIPHDIINGQPLHYRKTSDGQFFLYSVGWNENDDGGVMAFKNGSSAEINTDMGDWVWRYPQN
jgi:hypothetical protein